MLRNRLFTESALAESIESMYREQGYVFYSIYMQHRCAFKPRACSQESHRQGQPLEMQAPAHMKTPHYIYTISGYTERAHYLNPALPGHRTQKARYQAYHHKAETEIIDSGASGEPFYPHPGTQKRKKAQKTPFINIPSHRPESLKLMTPNAIER